MEALVRDSSQNVQRPLYLRTWRTLSVHRKKNLILSYPEYSVPKLNQSPKFEWTITVGQKLTLTVFSRSVLINTIQQEGPPQVVQVNARLK